MDTTSLLLADAGTGTLPPPEELGLLELLEELLEELLRVEGDDSEPRPIKLSELK